MGKFEINPDRNQESPGKECRNGGCTMKLKALDIAVS